MENFQKQTILHENDHCTLWLCVNTQTGEEAVARVFSAKGELCKIYDILQKNPHMHLPKIFAIEEEGDTFTVFEEHIHGVCFGDLLSGGKLFTSAECRTFAQQLCSALIVLHRKGILHRDIKPGNLLLTDTGVLKLIDFDAARLYNVYQEKDTRLLGTEGYAAPEQYGFVQTDFRADIYSFGVTMCELLGNAKRPAFERILSKCTRLDPGKRYQSAVALQRALTRTRLLIPMLCTAAGICVVAGVVASQLWPAHSPMPNDKTVPSAVTTQTDTVSTTSSTATPSTATSSTPMARDDESSLASSDKADVSQPPTAESSAAATAPLQQTPAPAPLPATPPLPYKSVEKTVFTSDGGVLPSNFISIKEQNYWVYPKNGREFGFYSVENIDDNRYVYAPYGDVDDAVILATPVPLEKISFAGKDGAYFSCEIEKSILIDDYWYYAIQFRKQFPNNQENEYSAVIQLHFEDESVASVPCRIQVREVVYVTFDVYPDIFVGESVKVKASIEDRARDRTYFFKWTIEDGADCVGFSPTPGASETVMESSSDARSDTITLYGYKPGKYTVSCMAISNTTGMGWGGGNRLENLNVLEK